MAYFRGNNFNRAFLQKPLSWRIEEAYKDNWLFPKSAWKDLIGIADRVERAHYLQSELQHEETRTDGTKKR